MTLILVGLDVPYEITVYTGDSSGAGTSANVFIVIYGAELNTGECVLAETKKKKKGCFERASTDQFVKEVKKPTSFDLRMTMLQFASVKKV